MTYYQQSLLASGLTGVIVAVVGVSGGYRLGRGLARLRVYAWLPTLLLLPSLVGDLSMMVLARDLVQQGHVFEAVRNRDPAAIWAVLLAAEIVQVLPLVAFFAWLQLAAIPPERREFASAYALTSQQRAQLLEFPTVRAMCLALCAYIAISVFWESQSVLHALRPTRGSAGHLVASELSDLGFIIRSSAPLTATAQLLRLGMKASVTCAVAAAGAALLLLAQERLFHRSRRRLPWVAFPGGARTSSTESTARPGTATARPARASSSSPDALGPGKAPDRPSTPE